MFVLLHGTWFDYLMLGTECDSTDLVPGDIVNLSNSNFSVVPADLFLISTLQVLLNALCHGYISLGRDISFLVFDKAHHAVNNHPYNQIMMEFDLSCRDQLLQHPTTDVRPMVLGLTASPIYGGNFR